MNKIKPRFKRFEMHGNLPAALQHGTVVSVSINKPKEVDKKRRSIENHANRIQNKSARGGRDDSKYPEEQ